MLEIGIVLGVILGVVATWTAMTLFSWPQTSKSLDYQLEQIQEWGKRTFPTGTKESVAEHIHREAQELLRNPSDPMEGADIFILLCHWARLARTDLGVAVRRKMLVNYKRTWGAPDAHGVIEHDRTGDDQ